MSVSVRRLSMSTPRRASSIIGDSKASQELSSERVKELRDDYITRRKEVSNVLFAPDFLSPSSSTSGPPSPIKSQHSPLSPISQVSPTSPTSPVTPTSPISPISHPSNEKVQRNNNILAAENIEKEMKDIEDKESKEINENKENKENIPESYSFQGFWDAVVNVTVTSPLAISSSIANSIDLSSLWSSIDTTGSGSGSGTTIVINDSIDSETYNNTDTTDTEEKSNTSNTGRKKGNRFDTIGEGTEGNFFKNVLYSDLEGLEGYVDLEDEIERERERDRERERRREFEREREDREERGEGGIERESEQDLYEQEQDDLSTIATDDYMVYTPRDSRNIMPMGELNYINNNLNHSNHLNNHHNNNNMNNDNDNYTNNNMHMNHLRFICHYVIA